CAACAEESCEEREECALLAGDLHHADRSERRGLGLEGAQRLVLQRIVGEQVLVERRGEGREFLVHAGIVVEAAGPVNAQADGLTAGTWRRRRRAMARVRVGDLDIAYEVAGDGEPVLLLMGLGGERHGWDLMRADLARGHRLILVDNRDAGESTRATGPYTIADMAGDALGVMDHLGIERFHVTGASMGGAIAQQLALVAPHRVATLGLVATWGRTDGFLAAVLRGWRATVARTTPAEFLASLLPWAFTHRYFNDPPAAL